jgi:hypothetical protein
VSVMCGRSLFCQLCVTGHWFVSYVCKVSGLSYRWFVSYVCKVSSLSYRWFVRYVCKVSSWSVIYDISVVCQFSITCQWLVSYV